VRACSSSKPESSTLHEPATCFPALENALGDDKLLRRLEQLVRATKSR
jgi:hypothetical protein